MILLSEERYLKCGGAYSDGPYKFATLVCSDNILLPSGWEGIGLLPETGRPLIVVL